MDQIVHSNSYAVEQKVYRCSLSCLAHDTIVQMKMPHLLIGSPAIPGLLSAKGAKRALVKIPGFAAGASDRSWKADGGRRYRIENLSRTVKEGVTDVFQNEKETPTTYQIRNATTTTTLDDKGLPAAAAATIPTRTDRRPACQHFQPFDVLRVRHCNLSPRSTLYL